ncbi:hypothetical protein PBC5p54 [Rhizobium etli CNPAF512]|nr:hypothetical protein PBC5p54 [Rhizobium etli CNPAF512]
MRGRSAFRRGLDHAERVQVGVEDRFLFHALLLVLFAQRHDLLQDLGVEAHSLGFAIDVLDVVGDGLLFFFQPFNALDESAKLVAGDAMSIRHRVLLIGMIILDARDCREAARGSSLFAA